MRCASSLFPSLLLLAARAPVASAGSGTVWATPHDSYSSSVGVLGCKIDTDRVAYWPGSVDCNHICVRLSYEGRSVYLLRVDQSGGAHDVSYDAWNYLYTGYPATKKPASGGATAMQYEDVDPSKCEGLIHTKGHKLPLSAANSMNFLTSCLAQKDSWVAQNYVLYNILDSICTWGRDEQCSLDYPAENQPKCPTTLGSPSVLKGNPVYNIEYPSGQRVLATSGQQSGSGAAPAAASPGKSSATGGRRWVGGILAAAGGWGAMAWLFFCSLLLLHSL